MSKTIIQAEGEEFSKGDRVRVNQYTSAKGKGLTYPEMSVTIQDNGFTGGWDVYDALTDEGNEVSFYGHSIWYIHRNP